jgi:hypothetical protein
LPFFEVVDKRVSVRKYRSDPVQPEHLKLPGRRLMLVTSSLGVSSSFRILIRSMSSGR